MDPAVAEFVKALHQCASESDSRYVSTLGMLRKEPAVAARTLEAAYRATGGERIAVRQSLLLAAAALAHPSVLPFLSRIAREPTSGVVRHDGGRAAEESALRLVAVDGIDAIAGAGDTRAADVLLDLVASTDRSVQAAAVVALKHSNLHRDHFGRVRAVLPADRVYLLDLRRANVREIPQVVDPRRHLLSEPVTIDTRPDLKSGERRNGRAPSAAARAPRVKEGR